MNKEYKAVPYDAVTHIASIDNEQTSGNMPAYIRREPRYCIISTDTGEILDDAQGYGYKTPQKAYAAYGYKNQSKKKKKAKAKKRREIEKWMKENQDFVSLIEDYAFYIAKGEFGPDAKFDAKLIKKLLKENNLETDFTPGELLSVWRNRKQ